MLDRLLDRRVSVSMVLLVFVVLGVIGIRRLPVSLIPDVDIPYVTVQMTAPDMSAREMDDAVVKPLRQSLGNTISNRRLFGLRDQDSLLPCR